jgi:c-di-GMP-binding flagellar brake protein YcgR
MSERRDSERIEVPLEVRVEWPDHETMIGITRDVSDGGAFILVVFDPPPPPGTDIILQLTQQVMGHDAPILHGRVVRADAEGVAFKFIEPEAP